MGQNYDVLMTLFPGNKDRQGKSYKELGSGAGRVVLSHGHTSSLFSSDLCSTAVITAFGKANRPKVKGKKNAQKEEEEKTVYSVQ